MKETEIDAATMELMDSIVREHQARLRTFLFGRVRDRGVAEDLAQEVFLVFMKRMDEYDQSRPAWPLLVGIAKNKLLEHWRNRLPEVPTDSIEEWVVRRQMGEDRDRRSVEEMEEWTDALHFCMEKLEKEGRVMMHQTYEDGLVSAKVAEGSRFKASSIRVLLCRLRAQLKNCIRTRLGSEPT